MADSQLIDEWLATIPPPETIRQTLNQPILSPPMSNHGSPPSKRPRREIGTPSTRGRAMDSVANSDFSIGNMGKEASPRPRTSPSRAIAELRSEDVVDYLPFSGTETPPPTLEKFLAQVKRISIGQAILSKTDFESIKSCQDVQDRLFKDILDSDHLIDNKGNREQLGKLPDSISLKRFWSDAMECEREGHSESSWNCIVHFPLLKAALELAKTNEPTSRLFEVKTFNVTTAKVAKPYITPTTPSNQGKRVDFCLCVKPLLGSSLEKHIYTIFRQRPHDSINHTSYQPITKSPIVLSIETKLQGQEWPAALEQMSTWMSSHWKRLRELTKGHTGGVNLEFLPGVIIQGHEWIFIAATQGHEADRGYTAETIIWDKILIGSTDRIQGICQIITFIQMVAAWSTDVYWPWFELAVLGD